MRYTALPVMLSGSYALLCNAWSFSLLQQPETCLDMDMGFSGGSPPYTFTFAHIPEVPSDQVSNISAWSSGKALSYSWNNTDPTGYTPAFSNYVGFTPLVIIGSDATGYGIGGTSEVFTVLPAQPPFRPDCLLAPRPNNTDYLSYLEDFSTNLTECGEGYIRFKNSSESSSSSFWIDTIVPLGSSSRTHFIAAVQNWTFTWPVTLTAGTKVFYIFDNGSGLAFVTPLLTVQRSANASCNPASTMSDSAPSALPTPGEAPNKWSGTERQSAPSAIQRRGIEAAVVGVAILYLLS